MADKLRPMSARTGIKKGGPGSEVPSTAGPSVGVGGAAALKTGGVRGLQMRTTGGKLAPGSIKTAMGNARKSTVPGPTRARVVPLHATKKPVPSNRKLMDAYDRYLIDLVQNELVQDMEKLQTMKHVEDTVGSVLSAVANQDLSISQQCNKLLLLLWEDLKKTELINKSFENLVDFSGEETLVELQTCLTKKFENIAVKGATLDNSAFSHLEINKVVDLVKEKFNQEGDARKVKGFIRVFTKALRKINLMSKKASQTSSLLELDTKLGLESTSLAISESAMETYTNGIEAGKCLGAAVATDHLFNGDFEKDPK